LDFEKAVVEFGTEAVLRYRTIAEARHDNELPESFLRGFVAMRLHERFGCQVHVERLYTAMALDLGMPIAPDLVNVLGAFRADIAVYESGRPFAVIELKIFDAASPLPSVGLELDKAQISGAFRQAAHFGRCDDLPDYRVPRSKDRAIARCLRWQHVHRRTPTFTRPPMAVVFCMRFSGRARRCAFVLTGPLLGTQRKCRPRPSRN
jgi:hypothetical protein